ncbi:MAG: dihydroorotase [Candidatus Omnitrophica bacterium]|nr:dihydroorotase [Candidatus Omnitrophota bacterium]MCM8791385.1 dihydroorotase [Candidatus Omnitrophota bacterium]
MRYLIKGGRVVDPVSKIDDTSDILIDGNRIAKVAKDLNEKCDTEINAKGKIVIPGLVDMHSHLREPGREDEETIATGTRAALRGGFTTIACMPNTEPPIDSPEMVRKLSGIIKRDAACHVAMVGAITLKRTGRKVAAFSGMKKEGVVAVSDDGSSVEKASIMLQALRAARKSGLLVIDHCEDPKMSAGGVMNKGFISTKMGLRGIPAEAESTFVKRDIELAKKARAKIHIAHVSCAKSIELIRKAKKARLPVTAETAPHYFSLTEDCCVSYDTNTKMNPPLRTKADVEFIKEALADGTIDVIATDHAPHTDAEKDVEFDFAPFGIIGFETALSLCVMELLDKGVLSWPDLVMKLSTNPAKILGCCGGSLKKGSPADITVIDPEKEYVYTKELVESKSKNSPFIGWRLKGKAIDVFVGGVLAMKDEEIMV